MAIKFNQNNVTNINFNNGTSKIVKKVVKDGVIVWCKPYSYTRGSLPAGCSALTCYIYSTEEPSNTTVTISSSGTIYQGDIISWSAGSTSGYIYEFDYVRVYSGSSTSGTLLANYTSGTSATFKMSGTYYSSIYVVLNYKKYQWTTFGSSYGWVLSTSSTTLSNMYGAQSLYTDIMRLSGTYSWSIAGTTKSGSWTLTNGGSIAISSNYGTKVVTLHFTKSGGTTSMTAYYSQSGSTSGTLNFTVTKIEYKKYS